MNTSALRKVLHEFATHDRKIGDVLGKLHQLMLEMGGSPISAKSRNHICTRSREHHERARFLDGIANRGTDKRVVLWVKAERKRLSKDNSLRLAERTALSLARRLKQSA